MWVGDGWNVSNVYITEECVLFLSVTISDYAFFLGKLFYLCFISSCFVSCCGLVLAVLLDLSTAFTVSLSLVHLGCNSSLCVFVCVCVGVAK